MCLFWTYWCSWVSQYCQWKRTSSWFICTMPAPTAASLLWLAADGSVVSAKTSSFVIGVVLSPLPTWNWLKLGNLCVVFFLYSFKNTQHDTNIKCVKLGRHASKEMEIPWIWPFLKKEGPGNCRCHDAERMLDEKERHPISSKDPHPLQPVLDYTRSTQLQLHLSFTNFLCSV